MGDPGELVSVFSHGSFSGAAGRTSKPWTRLGTESGSGALVSEWTRTGVLVSHLQHRKKGLYQRALDLLDKKSPIHSEQGEWEESKAVR